MLSTYLDKLTPSNYLGPHKVGLVFTSAVSAKAKKKLALKKDLALLLTRLSLSNMQSGLISLECSLESLMDIKRFIRHIISTLWRINHYQVKL